MAKKKLTQNTEPMQPAKKPKTLPKQDLLDLLDLFFTRRSSLFFYIALGLSVLFSILLFDVKVGIGGDDSTYILRAYDFIHDGIYPSYQGPLYPMILSPFIGIFGIQLPMLKLLSLIFTMLAIGFMYKALINAVPKSVLFPTLILISINYFVLYFASQTYSEAFFFFLQSIFLWFFLKHFSGETQNTSYKNFIILGLLLFLLSITRNIGLVAIAAVTAYFILQKQWKNALLIMLSFALFFLGFEILKRGIWNAANLQISGQGSGLMNKSFYDASKGTEDLSGFISRFTGNSNLYFSKHVFSFLGLRPEITETIPFYAIVIWGLLFLSFFKSFKNSLPLLFISVYVIGTSAATFLVVQTTWDQWRLIINSFPLILLAIFGGLYYTFKAKSLTAFQFALPILAIILFITTFSRTGTHVKTQKDILSKNLKGDMLYGYTPDWVNYIQMSKWVAANTPKDAVTAVRKSNISFIYSNRKFFNISVVPAITPDSLLKKMDDSSLYIGIKISALMNTRLKENKAFLNKAVGFVSGNFMFGDNISSDGNIAGIYKFSNEEFPAWEEQIKAEGLFYDKNIRTWIKNLTSTKSDFAIYVPEILLDVLHKGNVKYMILAGLRANPYYNTGNIITTLHRFVNFIQLKYPESFVLINTMGTEEISQLVELKI